MIFEPEVRVVNYLDEAIHFVYLPKKVLKVVKISEDEGAWLNYIFRQLLLKVKKWDQI